MAKDDKESVVSAMDRLSVRRVIAVSGGPDSVFLVRKTLEDLGAAILAHVNHGARGKDSDKDQEFVERLGRTEGIPVEVRKAAMTKRPVGFEKRARDERYDFLLEVKQKHGAGKILTAHTADDQVETVLMRILEGAGISGLKGIPRKTPEGIERPLLDTWREDILAHLRRHKIPYRIDKSNLDTRFERNWIRHVLIPLLEKRYGRSVKKRIFALGERFREVDQFLEITSRNWLKRHVIPWKKVGPLDGAGQEAPGRGVSVPRTSYSRLPSVVRKKVLQLLCFERVGIAPNERLLESMDKVLVAGGPSTRLSIGKGAVLRIRYDEAVLERRPSRLPALKESPKLHLPLRILKIEKKRKIPPAILKKITEGEGAAAFDADGLSTPLAVRPLTQGDRIRPFGLDAEKKVKEILIDRKVPRDERWGRPVICDAKGRILWIPGIVRSSHAPVTGHTRNTAVLRVVSKVPR